MPIRPPARLAAAAPSAAVLALGAALLASVTGCKRGLGSGFEGEITMRTTRGSGSVLTTVVKAKGSELRIEVTAEGGKTSSAIYLPDQDQLLVLDDERKTVTQTDLGSPLAPAMDASHVQKIGKDETIAGIDCEDYRIDDPGGLRTEACVAQGLPFLDFDALHGAGSSRWSRDLRAKKMFPLRTIIYDAKGHELSRTVVTAVTKEKLDDALFRAPAGYARGTRAI